jgi:RND superfamily putative drug exporter
VQRYNRPVTEKLARACASHPWRTVAAWLGALVAAVGLAAAFLPGNLTTDGHVTNDPDSLRGYDVIGRSALGLDERSEVIVIRSEEHTVDDPAFEARVRSLAMEASGAVAAADVYYDNEDEALVSADRHALLVPLDLVPDGADSIETVIPIVERANGRDGFQVAISGEFTGDHDFNELSQRDLEEGELRVGLPAALLVLVLAFGALVAASLPLLLALVSIVVAIGLTGLVAAQWELSVFIVNMLTAMGLALGIDYALFIVSRFREERAAGREKVDAVAAAGATASRAVLFSGSAFILAMVGMLLVQSTIMRSLAAGAILVAIASVAAALTLLPAVLGLLGDRVNRLRVPFLGREIARESARESRFWGWVVTRVTDRPALSLALATAVLLAAASPLVGLKIGASGIGTMPDSSASKQGVLALERSFPAAGADPALIVVEGGVATPGVRTGIRRLEAALRADGSFGAPRDSVNVAADAALITVPVAADPLADKAVESVRRLRSELVPAAFGAAGTQVLVTGTTAENIDYFDVMGHWLPIVLVFVLGLSFGLLTVAFRSVTVAATAIGTNLLSVGAAYGLLVLVFQHGVGAGLLGFTQVDTIEAWVPLFLFAVLFGLSMDYQVFLLSRIRERYGTSGDTGDAVTFGITSTARLITGAALIIVAVFAGFAMGDLVMFQQMGFGIGVALILDATIVRSVLVPATMTLLGERNWYLPRWLEWLPHVEVERGEHDAPPDAPPLAQ